MHKCNETRSVLVDIAFDEAASGQRSSVAEEFSQCDRCSSEYESMLRLLRTVDQRRRARIPDEAFWTGYNQRLRRRLQGATFDTTPSLAGWQSARQLAGKLITTSVRVPVYVAIAVVALIGVSVIVAIHARAASERGAAPVTVVTKFVEVPIVQDRIVTRVVYREYLARSVKRAARREDRKRLNLISDESAVAQGLVGFKPAQDVNLTIIKGSYREQK